ncbi:UDP-phosphate N-acetylglucosaminyl 1-phosphate transferase [Aggregicoccus sp. 17bor-14]|uniref:DNA polymerase beta superfamily protein n=1 Tax=Myxococcaceae TaxID=31 RepID=UPI00129CA32E|nr:MULTISPECIES: nucleotidyltransferase domain-containing protein [Myxococcaceae]MBF5043573.1 nucleotidyltransferase domain-containing protein [Simulacricoccus sp. 17bor-14]MRI89332.1 UDP-phosphate N-acetylglucosaminyl 1-phosphate transferase [Aggregicoccus sp. 17bor-14]
MTQRLSALSDIDPLSIPLPHGTEVTTRVERVVDGRRIPQGLIGRVVRARDGGFDVLIVGVGELWFARAELTPRKAGQLEFAQRRESSWAALIPCTVLTGTVGSRAWGLADEGSDTDVRGAFALPLLWTVGLVSPPVDLVSADGSQTFWETRKLVQQALRADPNTLELLFVPSAEATDVIGEWLLEARDAFVSKLMFGSFGRYALSQLNKLSASQRLAQHRDLVLDWLAQEPSPTLDEVAARLARISPRQAASPENALLQAKTYIKQLYRSLSDQGLIEANDFASMQRYARSGGRRPADARELRPKNAYNLLRLIHLAAGWLRDGAPQFEATGAFRERLLRIKRGEVSLDEVLAEAEALAPSLEQARDASRLPEHPDYVRADALLKRIGDEVARRHVQGVPGPFGVAAPPPPEPVAPEEEA